MPTFKTPDVYIQEIPVFPPSVAEVSTAIPAFVGHPAIAKKTDDDDLILKPQKIFSLKDFETYYGGPQVQDIKIEVEDDPAGGLRVKSFTPPDVKHILYYAVR